LSELLREFSDFLERVAEYLKSLGFSRAYTPILLPFPPPDVNVEFFSVRDGGSDFFLRTSPEVGLKWLGRECGLDMFFEIGQSFRKGEDSAVHSREFFMLEWYERGDLEKLLRRSASFLEWVCEEFSEKCELRELPLPNLFEKHWGVSPSELPDESTTFRRELGIDFDISPEDLFYLMVDEMMRERKGIYLLYDYPTYCFSLAVRDGEWVKRVEVFWDGVEVGNGYVEEWREEVLEGRVREEFPKERVGVIGFCEGYVGMSFGLDRIFMVGHGLDSLPWKRFWRDVL